MPRFLLVLWLSDSQPKVCQSLMLFGCLPSPRSCVAESLSAVQLKVELHSSLACTSCLWLPKFWLKCNQSLHHFITSFASILNSSFGCLVFTIWKLLSHQNKVQHPMWYDKIRQGGYLRGGGTTNRIRKARSRHCYTASSPIVNSHLSCVC